VGLSSEADHRFLDQMLQTRPPEEFATAMLEYRRVGWAAEELAARQGDGQGADPEGEEQ
jgi:hypothetical protein